jgi:hypothetical protein
VLPSARSAIHCGIRLVGQGRLLSTLLAAIADFERDLIRERTVESRKRAMAEGVKLQSVIVRFFDISRLFAPTHARAHAGAGPLVGRGAAHVSVGISYIKGCTPLPSWYGCDYPDVVRCGLVGLWVLGCLLSLALV